MSAHTPGPWFWADNVPDAPPHYRMIVDADGATVCDPSPMREADARLLAAAPALLEALKNCANVLALALPSFDDESTDGKDSRDEVESVLDAARDAIERATGGAP